MRQTPRIAKIVAPCAAVLLAALWLLPAQAQDMYSTPAASGSGDLQEAPVPFNHNEHNKKAKITKCASCHHPLPGLKRSQMKKGMERKCSDCHHERPAPTDRAASLMVVSHKLCQDCHNAKKKGPVKCSECHKTEAQPTVESQSVVPSISLFPPSTPATTPSDTPSAPPATGN